MKFLVAYKYKGQRTDFYNAFMDSTKQGIDSIIIENGKNNLTEFRIIIEECLNNNENLKIKNSQVKILAVSVIDEE